MKLKELLANASKERNRKHKQQKLNQSMWEKVIITYKHIFEELFGFEGVFRVTLEASEEDLYIAANVTTKEQVFRLQSLIEGLPWLKAPEERFWNTGASFRYQPNKETVGLLESLGFDSIDILYGWGYITLTCYLSDGAECKLVPIREEERIVKKVIYSFECVEGADIWEAKQ